VRNAPEVVREVGVHDFRVATNHQPIYLDHRLLGVAPGTVGILLWWKAVPVRDLLLRSTQAGHQCGLPNTTDRRAAVLHVSTFHFFFGRDLGTGAACAIAVNSCG
jgi:hypothetical protein